MRYRSFPPLRSKLQGRASGAIDFTRGGYGEGKKCDERRDKECKGCHYDIPKVEI